VPIANYIDLATLKGNLGIDLSDTTRDTQLTLRLASASRAIDKFTGRRRGGFSKDSAATARVYQPGHRLLGTRDGELFMVDEIADTAGLVVETGTTASYTAVAATEFEALPENAIADSEPITAFLRLSWGLGYTLRMRVTAKWGWPAVPDEVHEATLLQASRLWNRKGSPQGVINSAEWGGVRVARLDPDVKEMIQHLKIPGIG
jgi:hypothetical protein